MWAIGGMGVLMLTFTGNKPRSGFTALWWVSWIHSFSIAASDVAGN